MSQTSRIRRALVNGAVMTNKKAARDFACYRLGDVIWRLRRGTRKVPPLAIVTEMKSVKGGTPHACYYALDADVRRPGRPAAQGGDA